MTSDREDQPFADGDMPTDARKAVRAKAQSVYEQQAKARTKRIAIFSSAAGVFALAIAFAVTWVFITDGVKPLVNPAANADRGFAVTTVSQGNAGVSAEPTPSPNPVSAEPTPSPNPVEAAEVSPAATPGTVQISIYLDYLAPGAKQFQEANNQQIAEWISTGAAQVNYYPVAMLTAKSNGTQYSLRAVNAVACVGTLSPDTFYAYSNALLTKQPNLGSDGLSDDELADLAVGAGVVSPDEVRQCIKDGRYATWAKQATDQALKGLSGSGDAKLTSAPMVLVNGEPYTGDLTSKEQFAHFVLTAASDSYYSSPTPTPSH